MANNKNISIYNSPAGFEVASSSFSKKDLPEEIMDATVVANESGYGEGVIGSFTDFYNFLRYSGNLTLGCSPAYRTIDALGRPDNTSWYDIGVRNCLGGASARGLGQWYEIWKKSWWNRSCNPNWTIHTGEFEEIKRYFACNVIASRQDSNEFIAVKRPNRLIYPRTGIGNTTDDFSWYGWGAGSLNHKMRDVSLTTLSGNGGWDGDGNYYLPKPPGVGHASDGTDVEYWNYGSYI